MVSKLFKKRKNLKIIKKDIIQLTDKHFKDVNTIIHLASIANDPASNLDPKLTWEISCQGTMHLCELAKKTKSKSSFLPLLEVFMG